MCQEYVIVILLFTFAVVLILISVEDDSSYHDSQLIADAVEKILFIHSSSPDPEGVHASIHSWL